MSSDGNKSSAGLFHSFPVDNSSLKHFVHEMPYCLFQYKQIAYTPRSSYEIVAVKGITLFACKTLLFLLFPLFFFSHCELCLPEHLLVFRVFILELGMASLPGFDSTCK